MRGYVCGRCHAEEQEGLGVIYRVVIDIDAVGNRCYTLAVEDGLLIARDDLFIFAKQPHHKHGKDDSHGEPDLDESAVQESPASAFAFNTQPEGLKLFASYVLKIYPFGIIGSLELNSI